MKYWILTGFVLFVLSVYAEIRSEAEETIEDHQPLAIVCFGLGILCITCAITTNNSDTD